MKRTVYGICMYALTIVLFSCHKEYKVFVNPDFTVVRENNNNTVPVTVSITNNTTGADSYLWTFEGGIPATSTKRYPGIVVFNTAGSHKITLEATNDLETKTKELIINLDSLVTIDFTPTVLVNNFAPATVRIVNNTTGGATFSWTFAGGSPATSSLKQPADVTFNTPGDHDIVLSVSNGSVTSTLTKTITVAPALAADFNIVPSFEDEDYQAPLTATLQNTTVSGLTWQWTATGGTISGATLESPTISFPNPGTYTVTLVANNSKGSQTVSKSITVLPNTNLRTHSNVKFGINSAHVTLGSFYSTRLRKMFKLADPLDTAGKWIDVPFFGLDAAFSYNKFISPDSASGYGFAAIPQARATRFINAQDLCGCGPLFTSTDFDNMVNDSPLQPLSINPTAAGWSPFTSATANRVVLFQTQDGRKGAIKIKQYVSAGADSYIIADIKVQKN